MAATITYESALATLEAMFPECDKTIISVVLQQNRGHMENTVEHLMALSSGSNQPKPKPTPKPSAAPGGPKPKPASNPSPNRDGQKEPSPPPGASGNGSGIQIQPAGSLQRQSSSEVKQAHASSASSAQIPAVYAPKIGLTDRLPDDFLRPPSFFRHTQNSQVSADEQIALQLAAGGSSSRHHNGGSAGLPMALPVPANHHRPQPQPYRPQSSNRVASDAEIAAAAGGNAALQAAIAASTATANAERLAAAAAAGGGGAAGGDDDDHTPKARHGDYEAI